MKTVGKLRECILYLPSHIEVVFAAEPTHYERTEAYGKYQGGHSRPGDRRENIEAHLGLWYVVRRRAIGRGSSAPVK